MFVESPFTITDNGRLLAAGITLIQSSIHAVLPHSPATDMVATIGYLVREPARRD